MKLDVTVLRCGAGKMEDGTKWANLTAVGDYQNDDMFNGFPMDKYSVVGDDNKASIALADKIKEKLGAMKGPTVLSLIFKPVTKQGSKVLAVCGVA